MLTLLETPAAGLRRRLSEDRSLEAWHQEIVAEIDRGLGPAHAALFASPVVGSTGIIWTAPGRDMRRYADLPPPDRRALTAAAGSLLSDIRRLVESGAAPTVAAAWPALREVPAYTNIFAVDGRPVLTGWGHAGPDGHGGILARFDDNLAWYQPPAWPWRAYGLTFGALAVLALAAGLLLPLLGPWIAPSPMVCVAPPGQLALLDEQNRQAQRADDLRGLLASLDEEQGRRRLRCPLPAAPTPPAPTPPTPHADLPADMWQKHDLSILDGCWHKYTNMVTKEIATGRTYAVREWTLCFDRGGRGQQNIVWTDGARCENDLNAHFTGGDGLSLTDAHNCVGSRRMVLQGSTCRRVSDTEAVCDAKDLEGPTAGNPAVQGRFRR
jgi:hypothetical protein